jgi:hypothetical protein
MYRAAPVLLAVLLVAGDAATESAWSMFAPPGGGFAIEMPGTPSHRTSTSPSPLGSITDQIYSADANRFTVDYSDLPHAAVWFAGSDTLYKNAMGALLKSLHGKPMGYSNAHNQGHWGKEVVFETPPHDDDPGLHGKAQVFLVGDRLFVFQAMLPKNLPLSDVERFFASLKLEKKK